MIKKINIYNLSKNSPNEFLNSVLSSSQDNFIIVKFFATWCSPCKRISNTISSIENSSSNFSLVDVDVDIFPYIAKSEFFKVKTIPTLFIFKNKNLLLRIEDSSFPKEELEKILNH